MAGVQKLYCYVDETGQDTLGKLFIVATLEEKQEEYSRMVNKFVKEKVFNEL